MAAEVKSQLEGKWTHTKSENFDKFLDVMGLGFMKRKLAQSVTPVQTISVDGQTITINISAGPKNNTVSFKLDEEYDVDTSQCTGKGLASWSGGQLTSKITPSDKNKGKDQTVVREVINGELVQTMTVEGVVCKRYFKK